MLNDKELCEKFDDFDALLLRIITAVDCSMMGKEPCDCQELLNELFDARQKLTKEIEKYRQS